jgi:copper oxidase (laccase) domain-containing protein
MAMEFGSEPASIWAAIGPCIRECCYEVGPEVSAQFTSLFPEWANHPPPGGGKRNLNLAEANIRRMTAAGIPRPQIFDSGICTFCQIETYHSFRRQPSDPGRMLSAVARLS